MELGDVVTFLPQEWLGLLQFHVLLEISNIPRWKWSASGKFVSRASEASTEVTSRQLLRQIWKVHRLQRYPLFI